MKLSQKSTTNHSLPPNDHTQPFQSIGLTRDTNPFPSSSALCYLWNKHARRKSQSGSLDFRFCEMKKPLGTVLLTLALTVIHCATVTAQTTSLYCDFSCSLDQFQCSKSCRCIDQTQVCDGNYLDCGYKDISDELVCGSRGQSKIPSCSNSTSSQEPLLPCAMKRDELCGLSSVWWCDGTEACEDGLDEHPLLCHCDSDLGFEVVNNRCVQKPDSCEDGHIMCTHKASHSILCLHPIFQCDGKPDCPQGEDESPQYCSDCADLKNLYICDRAKGECIPDNHLCDHTIDCLSRTDETNCPYRGPSSQFQCGSDPLKSAFYLIDEQLRCDGIKQCIDGADETGCDFAEDKICSPDSCHHSCRPILLDGIRRGVSCYCDQGFDLAPDGYTCVPSLEKFTQQYEKIFAVLSSGDLLETTLDVFGNLAEKRILNSNLAHSTPIAMSPKDKFLIFFEGNASVLWTLVAFDLMNMKSHSLVTDWNMTNTRVTNIAYDSDHGLLFWTELDPYHHLSTTLKTADLKLPKRTAADLEFESCSREELKTFTLMQNSRKEVFSNLRIVTSFVLHPEQGQVFVTIAHPNGTGLIEVLNQDGSKLGAQNAPFVSQLFWPSNLKMDFDKKFIYFTNSNGTSLNRVMLTDSESFELPKRIETLKQMEMRRLGKTEEQYQQRILAFEVLSNQILYSEKAHLAFYTLGPLSNFNPDTSGQSVGAKIIQKLPKTFSARQMTGSLLLSLRYIADEGTNGKISECDDDEVCRSGIGICLPRGQSHSICLCPEGTTRDPVKKTCKQLVDPFVVISTSGNSLEKVGLHGENRVVISTMLRVTDITHDEDMLYWIDGLNRKIQKISVLNLGREEPDVLLADLDNPVSLAVDSANNVLFWSDRDRKTIQVAFLTGKPHPNVLISREKTPKYLALDLLDGLIFWSEEKSYSILRANMDGSDVKEIISSYDHSCVPDEIHFEPVTSQIFFSCSGIQSKKLFLGSITGEKIKDITELAITPGQNWCFTLFQRSVVIGRYGIRSYANHNGELDDAIDIPQDAVTAVDVYVQKNAMVSDPCVNKECSQRCLRISVSPYYACKCFFGYTLSQDGHSCDERVDSDILLISHDKGIKMMFLEDSPILPEDVDIPGGKERVGEFDFDPENKHLYYLKSHVNKAPEPIRRTHLLTGELQRTYAEGEDVVVFTFDKVGKKLYYSEGFCRCIKVSEVEPYNEKGEFRTKTLISKDIGSVVFGLLIDYDDGFLFWTHELEDYRMLERIDLNGFEESRRQVKAQKTNPGDFEYPAIDDANNRVYYNYKGNIEQVNLIEQSGFNTFEDVVDKSNINGITYLKNEVYFAFHESLSHTSIHSLTTSNSRKYTSYGGAPSSSNDKVLKKLIGRQAFSVNHIHAYTYDNSVNKDVLNACDNFNGHCEFLCLRTSKAQDPNMFSCSCPDGIQSVNSKQCSMFPESFLLLTTERIFYPDSLVKDSNFEFPQIIEPYSVDFLYRKREIFIGSRNNGVFKMDFNGNNIQQVLPFILELENIAVDWITENLYWISKEGLFVSQANGSFTRTLVEASKNRLQRPRALVVHPFKSFVFFSDWESPARISCVFMDGSGYKDIMTKSVSWPNSLTIDFKKDLIYWVDSSRHMIQASSLDGSHYRQIAQRPIESQLQSITFLNGSLYFTELSTFSALQIYNVTRCDYTDNLYTNNQIECKTLHRGYSNPQTLYKSRSLAFVTSHRQPWKYPMDESASNPCSVEARHGCEYLCLTSQDSMTCACPDKLRHVCTERKKIREMPSGNSPWQEPTDSFPPSQPMDKSDSPFAFELKLVMIVLVIIAVVVIILMIAILLLIRRHMIAAPPPSPHRAVFANHHNNPSATVFVGQSAMTISAPSRGDPTLSLTGNYYPVGRGRPAGHQIFRQPHRSKNNVYTDLPMSPGGGLTGAPHSKFVPQPHHFTSVRWPPKQSPPPYSPPSSSSRQGSTGGSSQGSSGNYQHLWTLQNQNQHISSGAFPSYNTRPVPMPFFVPGTLSNSNATTPMTFSENSSEDSQQHSNDESSTA